MHYIFTTILTKNVTLEIYLICILVSIILGIIIAFTASRKKDSTKTLELSLIIMPSIVQTIIMMVNRNVGTGVAVAGAFTLIRFTSAVGTAKDISLVFLAMATGIATGTGYLGIAVSLTIIICIVVLIVYDKLMGNSKEERFLKVSLVTDTCVNYEGILNTYANSYELIGIKALGSENIKKHYYRITLKFNTDEKVFVDTIYWYKGVIDVSYEKYEEQELRL